MPNLTLLQSIIVGLVPFAQVYARIKWLNGSLDKIWTLIPIFMFPPFSIIPAIMMKFGYVADGQGGVPYDSFMLIPIIAKFLLALIVPSFLNLFTEDEASDTAILLTQIFLQLLINTVPFLIRSYKLCTNSFNNWTKAFSDGTIANICGDILPVILTFIPIVGEVILEIKNIPLIGDLAKPLIWTLGYSTAYIFINMVNGTYKDSFCKPSLFGRNIIEQIIFIVSLVGTFLLALFDEINPL